MNRPAYFGILADQQGVALVVTLGIVVILVAGGLQLGKFTGESVMEGMVEKDLFRARQKAFSGIHLARLLLIQDAQKSQIDSIQETWADEEKLKEAVQAMDLADKLEIKIVDELSKIQVNALVWEHPGNTLNSDMSRILETFFKLRFSSDKAEDERNPAEIINSMKDWLDTNDDDAVSGLSGAESDYYLGLEPPYSCANQPFNHVDELLNVKGIDADLLKKEDQDTEEDIDDQGEEKQAKPLEFSDVFTVYGLSSQKGEQGGYRYGGKININTANLDVLQALMPEGMEDMAQDLVDFREEKGEEEDVFINTLDKGWYKKVIGLSEKEQKRLDKIIVYASHIFRVECTALENQSRITFTAVLKREKVKESGKWDCRILQIERKA